MDLFCWETYKKNNIDQSTQAYPISNYSGVNFIFVNEASNGDIFRFLILQNSGKSIKISGVTSRFNITYLGKNKDYFVEYLIVIKAE